MSLTTDLRYYFQKEGFRSGQRVAIEGIEEGKDVLVLLPTSGGKSLIFQLASVRQRIRRPDTWTLIICPLVALIHEQVEKLNQALCVDPVTKNIRPRREGDGGTEVAVYLGAGQTNPTLSQRVFHGEFPLVYMSPEKIATAFSPEFFHKVNLLVIDECHCVSEHGNTFRPAYRTLRDHIFIGPGISTVALTATATTRVHDDVVSCLRLRPDFLVVRQTMHRPNLCLQVVARSLTPTDIVRPATGRTLIYALTRKRCEQLSLRLTKEGIPAAAYHAGLDPAERHLRAEHFRTSDRRPVLVATICYGMGMDVPDIRLVLHDGLPKSILGYVQEVGRGGRDGQPSVCRLFFDSSSDLMKHKRMILDSQEELDHLRTMLTWAQDSTRCRPLGLLRVFGEVIACCGTCDVCTSNPKELEEEEEDGPEFLRSQDVVLLLRALAQTGNHHGRGVPVDFLLGSRKKNIRSFALRYDEKDSVYGRGRHLSRDDWMALHKKTVRHHGIREICTRQGYIIFKTVVPVPNFS